PKEIKEIEGNLELTNQNREATRTVNEYSVLELLGAGSYGSVYKVKKITSESVFAMKEINTQNVMWGASNKERQKSVGDVINELTIIREQLKHPNVVRYYKTFKEQDHLYIVMELIEGAALGEHFSSLKEKNSRFSEDRIWHIFMQLVLALRPELILNKPYGEKADIWAIGCILYQMCTLKPPFYSNILSLAVKDSPSFVELSTKIRIQFSPLMESSYECCITVSVDERPDIIGVASHISDILLLHMDQANRQCTQMERKLEYERNRSKM
ncbi:hypothetical protein LSH36_338g04055, partial [Paralvinella palmiformis]